MNLDKFARSILFGMTLEEKLVENNLRSSHSTTAPIEVPRFPGRPPRLAKPGKAKFPSLHRLHDPTVRGEVLHFFANHELLAMELMALVLLRFPDAPPSFRMGLARIIQEEQSHLRLYIARMQELGVDFGDLPVSDYFWNCMRGLQSPLEFVVQMSLTFEQANLDFSFFFMNAVKDVGDEKTAAVLERVYREEIGHVKHGVTWFNRWRPNAAQESDWEAYIKLLPLPMTPRRAKGLGFCAEARRQAGLSEKFIRELSLFTGSKGRPPLVWIFNPHCDSEIARGRVGFTATQGANRLTQDLEHIPLFLALDQDVVLVREHPRTEWIESLQKNGFETPEFSEYAHANSLEFIRAPKIGGMEPWGWSPDTFEAFRPLRSRLVEITGGNSFWCKSMLNYKDFAETGLGKLFSKSWSTQFLQEWLNTHPDTHAFFGNVESVGASLNDYESSQERIAEIIADGHSAMVKAPYGTSGRQVRQVQSLKELEGTLGGWIRNILASQGALIVERWLEKVCDFSIQMEIKDEGIRLLEVRRFITGNQNQYRGTYLGNKFRGFDPEHVRFLHTVFNEWRGFIRDLGSRLRDEGYRGPAGVDALLWKDKEGELRIKPLVELNPRWTMGRVALELEKHLAPGVSGLWAFLPIREIKDLRFENAEAFAREMERKYPVKRGSSNASQRIESGVVFTNDPFCAQEILTVMGTLPNPDLEGFLQNNDINLYSR